MKISRFKYVISKNDEQKVEVQKFEVQKVEG